MAMLEPQLELKEYWEIDQDGNIIENYFWTSEEYENAELEGRTFVDFGWQQGLYQPKFDVATDQWVEGKNNEEMLEERKKTKITELNSICNNEIIGGFMATNGHFYEFEEHDQNNFTQQMLLLVSNPVLTDIQWKTVDSDVILHSREEFLQVVTDAQNHKQGNISKYWQLKGLVEVATTVEEINAIVW